MTTLISSATESSQAQVRHHQILIVGGGAAAVRGQAPILVSNLLANIKGKQQTTTYGGYTCCPLITGYNSVMMGEFDYNQKPDPTFPFNPTKERFSIHSQNITRKPLIY